MCFHDSQHSQDWGTDPMLELLRLRPFLQRLRFNWKRDNDFPDSTISTHQASVGALNYGLINLRGTYNAAEVESAQLVLWLQGIRDKFVLVRTEKPKLIGSQTTLNLRVEKDHP